MSFGLLTLGTQSLQANQTALAVTGQNISNVNTEGYTRQRPVFEAREGQGGVTIDNIDRVADAFLNRQIWADSSTYSSYDVFEDFANELDNLLASDVTSISTAMDDYFGAMQTAVDDPVSLPNRELFIAQAESLTQRFNDLDANIRRQNETINGQLESSVAAINTLAHSIAELNDDIRIANASGSVSSELLDQRDMKLEELSEYIGFTIIEDSNSQEVSVFVGNGEPLVVGQSANTLTTMTSPADSSQLNLGIQIGNNVGDITSQVSGGKVGGMLDYRDTTLNETLDELGRIALVFADTMNEQHQKGMDLDGNAGGLMFADINNATAASNRVLAERDNLSSSTGMVIINDVSKVEATEYELIFNSDDTFTLIRGNDEVRWDENEFNSNGTPPANASEVDEDGEYYLDAATGDLTLRIDGFTLQLDATTSFSQGDKFLIQPTRNAASEIDTVINDASQLALGSPLSTTDDVANTGTGEISVSITDKDYADQSAVVSQLTPPLNVSFLSPLEATDTGTNTGTASNVQVADYDVLSAITYPVTITAVGGAFNVTDSGSPATTVTGVGAIGDSELDLSASFGITVDIASVANGDVFTIDHDDSEEVAYYQLTDEDGDRSVGAFNPGESIALEGFEITIKNQPNVNDVFTVQPNTDGVSDNSNALLLSDLQFYKTIEGASYQDKYGQTVERVGTEAAVAQLNAQAGKAVLDSNIAQRSSISGVNLDEEAAKLVQYQQAYQASAQLIQVAQTIFDTLLQSV
ncbi:flagellar hook-associated protein FlgK [Neptuniibacter sp. 1_MG-2023]|uniref:flagellar hook-associated protein FlgK n=1 Tax=Neptuniibacter sp. 1_MG-2023 TaxID=3062662 RepID=UPI0026E27836|nr:flagellar hook-associated protein FlgK [Neptuniibacter sp. 1_MG-2023]MDO6595099.1 flagellar hook-associated protein FlgK [Neptuniibacter sp. 1_MG-2023]